MPNTILGLSFDARDAQRMATFWAAVLGRTVAAGGDTDDASIDADPDIAGSRIAFHRVPEDKTVKNRMHLDLVSRDFTEELDRLIGLGASRVNEVENGGHWVTLADPEGNEFDLIEI